MAHDQLYSTDLRDPRDLKPHPDNPRFEIDPESEEVIALSEDISQKGVLQPIVITPDGYVLIGHRRRLAAIRAGIELVPVTVRDLRSTEFPEDIFLAENMQRQDLSPLEEARALDTIWKKMKAASTNTVTFNDLCRRTSLPAHMVRSRLAILELPERVQKLFHILELPITSAVSLAKLAKWPDEVEKFADRLLNRQLAASVLATVVKRRIDAIEAGEQEDATAPEQAPRTAATHYVPGEKAVRLTRESVMESLAKKGPGTVSMFNLKLVLDSTCCSCGMIGNQSVCNSCPLPRFVSGLIGRADEV